eukprot:6011044-Pyramimonas_sp.AAC.1
MASRVTGAEIERSRVFARTSKCDRCAGPEARGKSRNEPQGWQENVRDQFKIRCAECCEFLKTEAEITAN